MFSLPQSQSIFILNGQYSIPVVFLSVTIACVASYIALFLNQKIQQNGFFHKNFWLLLASVAMGLGIWSMHFIGMSAFMLPIPMKYDLLLTIISVFPAILASYLAFAFANKQNPSQFSKISSGFIMGMGISSMHYLGMDAMEMDAKYIYDPWIFLASLGIAIGVSYIAMFVFSTLQKYMQNQLIRIITSILMGFAITSMHYTGMAAVIFYLDEPLHFPHNNHVMDMGLLIIVVAIGIFSLFIIVGLASLLDHYVDYRLKYFDTLTLLPNQRQFEKDSANSEIVGSLAIIHIHNLEKWIRIFGYTLGDKIIKLVGEMIETVKIPSSKIYRIEGNRFAIVYPQDHDSPLMKVSMERILNRFKEPLVIDEYQITVESVCAYSHCVTNKKVKELLSNSMDVLQHPTIQYQHEVIEYDPSKHTFNIERRITQDIHHAMNNHELYLVYQPKVLSSTKELSGLEALIRWEHPTLGNISPAIFIPILEENSKIFDVTDWVIEQVFQQVEQWTNENFEFQQVSINIPGPYLASSRLYQVITELLEKYKIKRNLIELEITETSVVNDIEHAISTVYKFRDLGLSVALDDFGTGLSSLSYLKKIPISTIKIDKSFVDDVPCSQKDSDILKAIITLCNSLHLKVVIEGVETKEQFDFIVSLPEIPHIQGYYFSRPLKVSELHSWVSNRRRENS